MTNGQINCFITVVEEKSFAKAANALFISQPAISKSISKMEDELGFLLLERRIGSLRLTAAGNTLYQFFKKSRSEYQELIGNIQGNLNEPFGTVKIGCPETWDPSRFYGKIMEYFENNYPSIKVEVECCRLPELMSRLQAGKLDIIMTHEFYPPVQYGFTVRHLTETGCGILYSATYFKEVQSVSDLNGVDFLTFDSDLEKKFGQTIRKVCSDYGFVPSLKNCGHYSGTLFEMSCGKGVMFFTEWDNAVRNNAYTYFPLDYKYPINIIYPMSSTNANTNLIADELVALFADSDSAEI